MALIKFLRGSSQNISFDKTPYNDGYLYFTTDDGKLYIDANGERIKINSDQIGCVWGVCETAGSLSAKEITLDEFNLEVGTSIKVKFISSNEVENPTLNINNTGAYPITYRGSAIRPDYLSANGVFEFAFDGDSWEYIGIINSAKEDLDVLFLENVEISTLSWEEDPSYPDYPYSAKIVCQGVTENHFPNVVFSTIDANSGNFAPVTKTEKNLIYIYAKEIPADDITIPSIELTPSGIQDLDVLLIENIEISAQSWEQDSTYPDYPYSAKIAYQGVTENYFPNVAFSTEDANGGNFAPIAKTEENLIYIYAKKVPEGNIIIPSIELTPFDEGNAAVVVLDATLTKEGMAADAKAVGDKFTAIENKVIIPGFDFAAMGLPALIPNGGEVSVQCDCTELCAALEQGATKILFMANVGQEVPVSGTVNAMKMLNGYSCGFVGCYTGIPMILSFDIYTNQITGRIISILQAVL